MHGETIKIRHMLVACAALIILFDLVTLVFFVEEDKLCSMSITEP